MRPPFFILLATLAMLGGCGKEADTSARRNVIDAIQVAEAEQAAALGRNDLDGAMAVFAEDATLYLPNMPPAHGREAIKTANERALKDPALGVVIDEGSRRWWVSASGDLATTTYSYAWTHTNAGNGMPVTEHVISQTTWAKQVDGSWKNVSDLNAVYPALEADRR